VLSPPRPRQLSVTESPVMLPPHAGKHRGLVATTPDRSRAPSLFALSSADDAGARFTGADWFRAPVVRMPQMRPRRDQRHCIGPVHIESRRLARGRTHLAQLRADFTGATHARYTEPGSAVHGLRFSHEVDGDRAERVGTRLANIRLPALPTDPASHHCQRRDRGLDRAEEVGSPEHLALRRRPPWAVSRSRLDALFVMPGTSPAMTNN
jgi:hypothetical protein